MNIISSSNNTNAVSLRQLIPEHESLKLLILHTPFNIQIGSLSQCLNLVKLDLSKNNIHSFPFLGHLPFLRMMFIHENHLTITQFISIFQSQGQQSILSNNIVWITYWGNKDVFLARHFAANRTKAIAFDKNIIVDEQKTSDLSQQSDRTCFTQLTDISEIFLRRNLISTYTTEEEYMQDFWISLRTLRRKYEDLNPILKIQKVFRGWIFREKVRRELARERERYLLLLSCFREWRGRTGKERKLARILVSKRKGHLLYPHSKITRQQVYQRMKQAAREARKAVTKRRLLLQNEITFYSVLRNNLLSMQDLYNYLQLSSSAAVYIYKGSVDYFVEFVVPFVANFTREPIEHSLNHYYHMHSLHQPPQQCPSELIKVMKTNRFSLVSYEKPLEKMLQVIQFKKATHLQAKMKAVFGKIHLSREEKERTAEQQRKMEQTKKLQREQLVRIEGSTPLLQTIARGVSFYNQRRLELPSSHSHKRIFMFSEGTLRRISSAISIQRAWRGYIFRKKNEGELKVILKYQKAAITIQRWFRRLPLYRKKHLLFEARRIAQFQEAQFLVDFEEYREQIGLQEQGGKNHIMMEQHCRVYKDKERGHLVVSWDERSSKSIVREMMTARKGLFSSVLLRPIISLPDSQLTTRTVFSPDRLQPVLFSHLFHYQTCCSMVRRHDRKYIEIKCNSKSQAQFRIFCLTLLSFNFKEGRGMEIRRGGDVKERVTLGVGQVVIVCNESIRLVRTVEESVGKEQNISVYMISNKIFLPLEANRKPFKVQEKFFVYMLRFIQQPQQHLTERVEINASLVSLRVKEEHLRLRMSANNVEVRERKLLVRKRSIKQFNSKVSRRDKKYPHFIIDNKSSERDKTHNQSLILSSHRQQQPKGKSKEKGSMHQRREQRRREEQIFTRQFVNMGNFIQKEQLNDQRRRIKTESKEAAHLSYQEIKLSHHRSSTHKKEQLLEKYRKARELEALHRSLLDHNRIMSEEHGIILKSNVSLHKQEKGKGRSWRKAKVSFAEQSFPIIGKKRNDCMG